MIVPPSGPGSLLKFRGKRWHQPWISAGGHSPINAPAPVALPLEREQRLTKAGYLHVVREEHCTAIAEFPQPDGTASFRRYWITTNAFLAHLVYPAWFVDKDRSRERDQSEAEATPILFPRLCCQLRAQRSEAGRTPRVGPSRERRWQAPGCRRIGARATGVRGRFLGSTGLARSRGQTGRRGIVGPTSDHVRPADEHPVAGAENDASRRAQGRRIMTVGGEQHLYIVDSAQAKRLPQRQLSGEAARKTQSVPAVVRHRASTYQAPLGAAIGSPILTNPPHALPSLDRGRRKRRSGTTISTRSNPARRDASAQSSNTGLSALIGMALGGDELFVTAIPDGAVLVFGLTDEGDAAPRRTIAGPSTQTDGPTGLFADMEAEEIFVPNVWGSRVTVYNLTDSEDVAPKRTIAGATSGIANPEGVVFDDEELFVIDAGATAVLVYGSTDDGDIAPRRRISGGNTMMVIRQGLCVANGEIFVADAARRTPAGIAAIAPQSASPGGLVEGHPPEAEVRLPGSSRVEAVELDAGYREGELDRVVHGRQLEAHTHRAVRFAVGR